jgi:hypothetical protein
MWEISTADHWLCGIPLDRGSTKAELCFLSVPTGIWDRSGGLQDLHSPSAQRQMGQGGMRLSIASGNALTITAKVAMIKVAKAFIFGENCYKVSWVVEPGSPRFYMRPQICWLGSCVVLYYSSEIWSSRRTMVS